MRKTMRTAFVTAAIVGLGMSGAAAASADGGYAYDNDKQGDSLNTMGHAYQGAFGQGATYGANASSVSDDGAGAGFLDD
ncbi:hypothetical protein [Streptomyces sp. ODS28]|uniref:hypothetical protein n=1 Tax=Streptomyces sp. ODS28 TaxID=3136688 RepID=UPI0031F07EDD